MTKFEREQYKLANVYQIIKLQELNEINVDTFEILKSKSIQDLDELRIELEANYNKLLKKRYGKLCNF